MFEMMITSTSIISFAIIVKIFGSFGEMRESKTNIYETALAKNELKK